MIGFQEHHGKSDLYPFTLLRDTSALFSGAFSNQQRWEVAANLFQLSDLQQLPQQHIPLYSFWERCKHVGVHNAFHTGLDFVSIERNWHFIQHNAQIIHSDVELLKQIKTFQSIPSHVRVTGPKDQVFIEEGATLEQVILNTVEGPVYISKQALIMDGACLRGPVFIGEKSVVKMGTVMYGGTSIGEHVIVGGEIKNSIINAFSNKAHDGYLGDSIIGQWCNLGASTTVSNVKNTASAVDVWNMHSSCYENAGKKCGTMMGDFTRTAINTSLNTGTVIGICSNLVPSQIPVPKFVPNFTWLHEKETVYLLDKALIDIQNWMRFKGKDLSENLKDILLTLFNNRSI